MGMARRKEELVSNFARRTLEIALRKRRWSTLDRAKSKIGEEELERTSRRGEAG